MKKKTLAVQLAEALRDVSYFRGRVDDTEKSLRETKDRRDFVQAELDAMRHREIEHSRNLLEIVRWHTNPETAKFPFRVEKTQRDQNGEYRQNY